MTLISSRMVRGRCPVCGGEHAACGTPSESTPVDGRMEVAAVGEPLKRYEVTMPSGTVTTMKLNDGDAKRLGVLKQETETEATEEPAQPTETETPAKSRTTRNKSRTAADKGGAGGGND